MGGSEANSSEEVFEDADDLGDHLAFLESFDGGEGEITQIAEVRLMAEQEATLLLTHPPSSIP